MRIRTIEDKKAILQASDRNIIRTISQFVEKIQFCFDASEFDFAE